MSDCVQHFKYLLFICFRIWILDCCCPGTGSQTFSAN